MGHCFDQDGAVGKLLQEGQWVLHFLSNPNKLGVIGKGIPREIQWRLNQLNSSKYSGVILFCRVGVA